MKTKRQRTVITIETVQRTTIRSRRGATIVRHDRGENDAANDFTANAKRLRDGQRITEADGTGSVESENGDLLLVFGDSPAAKGKN